jgi:hypothetical protein
MNKYNIYINCIVLSTDIHNNKQFVLSLSKDEIQPPQFECNIDFLNSSEKYLIEFLKKYIFVHDMELLPQLISLNYKNITSFDDPINIVYGFITNKTNNINDSVYWYEFDYTKPNIYNRILLEVTQKLK